MSVGTQEGSSSSGTVMMVEGSAAQEWLEEGFTVEPFSEVPRNEEEDGGADVGRGWTKSRPWRTSHGKGVAHARGLDGSPPYSACIVEA